MDGDGVCAHAPQKAQPGTEQPQSRRTFVLPAALAAKGAVPATKHPAADMRCADKARSQCAASVAKGRRCDEQLPGKAAGW